MTSSLEIACPRCSQRNRLPAARVGQAPACGKCHRLLLDLPVTATRRNLSDLLVQTHLPLVVDFWAPWCAPCRGFAPAFEAAAARFAGQTLFVKVDTAAEQSLAQQFNIRSIPTLVVFSGGREIRRLSGALPAAELEGLVRQTIADFHAGPTAA